MEAILDKVHAEKILKAAVALDHNLGRLDTLISGIEDRDEKQKYIKALGEVMALIARRLIFPIMAEYPDLDDTPEPLQRLDKSK